MRIEPYDEKMIEGLATQIFKAYKELMSHPDGEKRAAQVEKVLSVWTVEEDGTERYALDQLIVYGEGSISIGSLNPESLHGRVIFSKKSEPIPFTISELMTSLEALLDERPLDALRVTSYPREIHIRAAYTGPQAVEKAVFTGTPADRTHFSRLVRHWATKQGGAL